MLDKAQRTAKNVECLNASNVSRNRTFQYADKGDRGNYLTDYCYTNDISDVLLLSMDISIDNFYIIVIDIINER